MARKASRTTFTQQTTLHRSGFTIVELLIVVVVIAILAAITIVAYNGIQNRAKASAAQATAKQAYTKIQSFAIQNAEIFPTEAELEAIGLKNENGVSYQYRFDNSSNPKTFCITATTNSVSYFVSNSKSSPTLGGCDGHGTNGQPAITNLHINPQVALNGSQFGAQTPSGNITSRSPNGGPDGQATYDVTTTVNGQLRIAFKSGAMSMPVTAGEQYNFSFYLYSSISIPGTNIEVNFSSPTTYVLFPIGNVDIGWKRYNAVVTVPTGITNLSSAQLMSPGSISSSSANFKITKVQITKGSTLYEFADGYSPGWIWNGTPGASSSTGPPLQP